MCAVANVCFACAALTGHSLEQRRECAHARPHHSTDEEGEHQPAIAGAKKAATSRWPESEETPQQ